MDMDNDALSRAVRNLLENAVKYSPEHHGVEVGVRRSNGDVRIAVGDRGIGIPAYVWVLETSCRH
jgi:signal transduction histidine kinase